MPLRAFGVQLKIELVTALEFEKRLRTKRSSPNVLEGGRPVDHKLAILDYCGFGIGPKCSVA